MSSNLEKKDSITKKSRAVNFDLSETSLIVNLVNKKKEILFNKETNKINNDLKNKTWEIITDEFNAISTRQIFRTKDSLIGLWKKTKTQARSNKALQKREVFGTGGGPSTMVSTETEQQAIFDGALSALGDTIRPLFTTADSDAGYHDNEIVFEDTSNVGNVTEVGCTDTLTQLSDSGSCHPNTNVCSEENVIPSDNIENTEKESHNSMFKTGNKRRRSALKSTYERLNNITTKKLDQMSRNESNEEELMDIKRKRFKLEESLAKKNEELINAHIRYFEDKNRREEEIHQRQLLILDRTMENTP